METKFIAFYKKYTDHYKKREYDSMLELIPDVDLNFDFTSYLPQVAYVLRTAFLSLKTLKGNNTKRNVAIANLLEQYIILETKCDYEKGLTFVHHFTQPYDYEACVPLIANLKTADFDLSAMLNKFTSCLKDCIEKKTFDSNSKKTLLLSLTKALLFYVNAEYLISAKSVPSHGSFEETKNFLEMCMELKCFNVGPDVEQYGICLRLLILFINGFDCGKFDKNQSKLLEKTQSALKSMSKTARATLVQDNYITLGKIMIILKPAFRNSLNGNNANTYFEFMYSLANGIGQIKYEKTFCHKCNDSIGAHELYNLMMLACDLYKEVVERNLDDSSVPQSFRRIFRMNMIVLAKMKCLENVRLHVNSYNQLSPIRAICQSKEKYIYFDSVIIDLLQNISNIHLDGGASINEYDFLYRLFETYKAAEEWIKMTNIGYLLIWFYQFSNKTGNIPYVAYMIANTQKTYKYIKFATPYEYFTAKDEKFCGLKLPSGFDHVDVAIAFIKHSSAFYPSSPEIYNKIIYQLFMKPSDKSIEFALHMPSTITIDKMTADRMDGQLKKLIAQLEKTKDPKYGVPIGALTLIEYNNQVSQYSKEFKSIQTSDILDAEKSAFDKMNLDLEQELGETLITIKNRFIKFTNFYLKSSKSKQSEYQDETAYVLREMNAVARHLLARNYFTDAMEAYLALYHLSKISDDGYGMLNSCSFFAENSAEFKKLHPTENLSEMISACHLVAIKKLQTVETLSLRKQNQLFYFLLNMVLYYLAENQRIKAKLMMQYVFNKIGGLDGTLVKSIGLTAPDDNKASSLKVQYEAVRVKFYAVLFTMMTRYYEPCRFTPLAFIDFAINHVINNVNLSNDDSVLVTLTLYKLLSECVNWCLNRYQSYEICKPLTKLLLKLSYRMGFVQRVTENFILLAMLSLWAEDMKVLKQTVECMESMVLNKQANRNAESIKKEETTWSTIDSAGRLCEPIRKKATNQLVLSPTKVFENGQEISLLARYLAKHSTSCKCAICSNTYNKFLLFQIATIYARYVYIDESFDKAAKKATFTELYDFWQDQRKRQTYEKNDQYYLFSARMLIWCSHYDWKFEKDYKKSKELLQSAQKGLNKVSFYDFALKQDIDAQIETLEQEIQMPREQRWAGIKLLNQVTIADAVPTPVAKKTVAEPTPAKTQRKPKSNLIDLVMGDTKSFGPDNVPKFQIHDDESAAVVVTPSVKTAGRPKKIKETPTATPMTAKKSEKQRSDLMNRNKVIPIINLIEDSSPVEEKSEAKRNTNKSSKSANKATEVINLDTPPAEEKPETKRSVNKPRKSANEDENENSNDEDIVNSSIHEPTPVRPLRSRRAVKK